MKEKYIITFKGNQRNVPIRVAYDEGILSSITFMDQDTPFGAREWCLPRIPARVENLEHLGASALIELEPTDLSFPAFWESYGNKQNKDRAMRFWLALNDEDRLAALRAIARYNRYLQHKPNIEKKYPDTWLKNRSWTDEYRIKQ